MAGCGIFVFQADFLQIGLTCFKVLSFFFFFFLSLSLSLSLSWQKHLACSSSRHSTSKNTVSNKKIEKNEGTYSVQFGDNLRHNNRH